MPVSPKARYVKTSSNQERGRHALTRQQRGYGADWEEFRDREFARQITESGDPFCRLCQSRLAGTKRGGALLDHLIPPSRIARPGTAAHMRLHRDQGNLVPACQACNDEKGNRLPGEITNSHMRNAVERLVRERGIELCRTRRNVS